MGQKLIIDKDTLVDIADAVREKSGTSELIQVGDLSQAILDIPSGGGATKPYREDITLNASPAYITQSKLYGYNRIPPYMFYNQTYLTNAEINGTIDSIGTYAFFKCTELSSVTFQNQDSIKKIESSAFYECTKLALTALPTGITSIGPYAFKDCARLALTSLPSKITTIEPSAFYGCTNLTSITFTSLVTTINSSAFSNCTNLTTINVPWSAGSVAGAPWGATNATINYNYTGD